MKRLLVVGGVVLIAVEVAMAFSGKRSLTVVVGGAIMAVFCYELFASLSPEADATADEDRQNDAAAALQRWRARTQTLIGWADGTRGDWDRHLRPMLAREFQMSTGHRRSKDRAALDATGRITFGPELWRWVDPAGVASTGRDEPAPGSAALDAILQRLEQM